LSPFSPRWSLSRRGAIIALAVLIGAVVIDQKMQERRAMREFQKLADRPQSNPKPVTPRVQIAEAQQKVFPWVRAADSSERERQ
jgi:hypothetical protein